MRLPMPMLAHAASGNARNYACQVAKVCSASVCRCACLCLCRLTPASGNVRKAALSNFSRCVLPGFADAAAYAYVAESFGGPVSWGRFHTLFHGGVMGWANGPGFMGGFAVCFICGFKGLR